jgi:ABC-type lipoprotein release transport system permease subunit
VLDLPVDVRASTVVLSTAGAGVLAAAAGLLASRPALRAAPLEVLRATA